MCAQQKQYRAPDITLAVFFQWINVIMVMVNVGLGMAIVAGGIDRFPSPTYDALIDVTNGRVWIWGFVILIAGVWMSMPFRKFNMAGLWLSTIWHTTWALSFIVAVFASPHASATAIPAYGGFAMISFALLAEKVLEKAVIVDDVDPGS